MRAGVGAQGKSTGVALADALSDSVADRPYAPGVNPSGWAFWDSTPHTSDAARRTILRYDCCQGSARFCATSWRACLRHRWSRARAGSAYIELKCKGYWRHIGASLRHGNRSVSCSGRSSTRLLRQCRLSRGAGNGFCARIDGFNAERPLGAGDRHQDGPRRLLPVVHYRRVTGMFPWLLGAVAADPRISAYRPEARRRTKGVAWAPAAPTSPAITNLICRRLDAWLTARSPPGRSTRVMPMTSRSPSPRIRRSAWSSVSSGWIDQICQREGFTENTKSGVFSPVGAAASRGSSSTSRLLSPRRGAVRAILSNVKKSGLEAEARGNPDLEAWLRGFRGLRARWCSPRSGRLTARPGSPQAGSA